MPVPLPQSLLLIAPNVPKLCRTNALAFCNSPLGAAAGGPSCQRPLAPPAPRRPSLRSKPADQRAFQTANTRRHPTPAKAANERWGLHQNGLAAGEVASAQAPSTRSPLVESWLRHRHRRRRGVGLVEPCRRPNKAVSAVSPSPSLPRRRCLRLAPGLSQRTPRPARSQSGRSSTDA
jgi:hypothetical protein